VDECKPLLDGGIDSAELLAIRRARGDLTAAGAYTRSLLSST